MRSEALHLRVFEALLRTDVRTMDEYTLEATVEGRLEVLVDGLMPSAARAVLADLALDRLHQELTAQDIWAHLSANGARRRRWGDDPSVLAHVQDCTDRYLDSVGPPPAFGYLARPEAEQILARLGEADGHWALVTSEAGGGKSFVLAEVVRRADALHWPTLAFRLDTRTTTSSASALGCDQLDLPASPTAVLRGLAAGRPCLLVIDQLDAASSASGRNSALFACVEEMLLHAQDTPNMRVLLACRTFDLESSPELRRHIPPRGRAEPIALAPLTPDVVSAAVRRLGLDARRLTERQIQLLQIPLHLTLLEEVAGDDMRDPLAFGASHELFAHYWEVKDRAVTNRLHGAASWTAALDVLVDDMSARHRLFTPQSALDAVSQAVRALASEHVIVREEKHYRFFHEAFFDYAFARRFYARGRRVADFLLEDAQDLFRRAQVRQILVHERGEDREQYVDDLGRLLRDAGIRFHIKALVLDLLGQVDDPSPKEWAILQATIEAGDDEDLARRALTVVVGWPAWQEQADRSGTCAAWLASQDPRYREYATRVLGVMQATVPDRVAELLLPYVDELERADQVLWILQATEAPGGDAFRSLLSRCLQAGLFTPIPARPGVGAVAVGVADALVEHDPGWVCAFLGAFLTRSQEQASVHMEDDHEATGARFGVRNDRTGRLFRIFLVCAKGAPRAFVVHLLPYMQRVVAANLASSPTSQGEPDRLRRDGIWGMRYRAADRVYTVKDALPSAMETAFQYLGDGDEQDYQVFDQAIAALRGPAWAGSDTGCYLLLRAYAAAGPRRAEDAVSYLADHPLAFGAGYIDQAQWAAREVLTVATPSCSPETLARLERVILAYFPPYERRPEGRKGWGYAQFVLLGGIDPDRLSPKALRTLGVWRRKFQAQDALPPSPGVQVGWVQSPIPEPATAKMNDAQWLRAIARYRDDDIPTRRRARTDVFVGGTHALAGQLRIAAQGQPSRFAAFALRIPQDAHPAYAAALLAGLEDATLEERQIEALCRHIHALPVRPCGRELCRFIGKRLGSLRSADSLEALLEIVTWYATEALDPPSAGEVATVDIDTVDRSDAADAPDDAEGAEATGGAARDEATSDPNQGGAWDAFTVGINSVRGAAAEALVTFVEADPTRIAILDAHDATLVDRLVRDPSVAVRACAAGIAAVVAQVDLDRALVLFAALVDGDDAIFVSPHMDALVRRLLRGRPEVIEGALARMRASAQSQVVLHGAIYTCVLGLLDTRWASSAATCLEGGKQARLGAAQVYAANLTEASYWRVSEAALIRLFDDADEEVRAAAAGCFQQMGPDDDVATFADTIQAFLGSAALDGHAGELFAVLRRSTGGSALAELTYEACARYLERAGEAVSDIRTAAAHGDRIAELIARAYDVIPRDSALRALCLDVVDALLRRQTHGIGRMLAEYDTNANVRKVGSRQVARRMTAGSAFRVAKTRGGSAVRVSESAHLATPVHVGRHAGEGTAPEVEVNDGSTLLAREFLRVDDGRLDESLV